MNTFLILSNIFFISFVNYCITHVQSTHITFRSVTDTHAWFIHRLYLEDWNADDPSDLDPATSTDASARLELCKEITENSIFAIHGAHPVDIEEIQSELMNQRDTDSFRRIFSPAESSLSSYEYNNQYERQEFEFSSIFLNNQPTSLIRKKEFTFVCLLKYEDDVNPGLDLYGTDSDGEPLRKFFAFYVSKAYKINAGLHAHRFIIPGEHTFYKSLMLVEGSAVVYDRPDFNVELHYLELRKRHKSEEDCDQDPVCRLNLGHLEKRQLNRLCSIVLTSLYFKDTVKHPSKIHHNFWFKEIVSFRTEEGKKKAKSTEYFELMLGCFAWMKNGGLCSFYISRAYNPNQVFVYEDPDDAEHKFYLKNLSINIGVVYERYNFGDVEI